MRMRSNYWYALILAGSALFAGPASADGTMGLGEVLAAVARSPNLVAEIEAELAKDKIKPADVTCLGARHGNHWKYLGGARAAPYHCQIGPRAIAIEADRVYFDPAGKPLRDPDKADPKRAKTFREDNFSWTWTP